MVNVEVRSEAAGSASRLRRGRCARELVAQTPCACPQLGKACDEARTRCWWFWQFTTKVVAARCHCARCTRSGGEGAARGPDRRSGNRGRSRPGVDGAPLRRRGPAAAPRHVRRGRPSPARAAPTSGHVTARPWLAARTERRWCGWRALLPHFGMPWRGVGEPGWQDGDWEGKWRRLGDR